MPKGGAGLYGMAQRLRFRLTAEDGGGGLEGEEVGDLEVGVGVG